MSCLKVTLLDCVLCVFLVCTTIRQNMIHKISCKKCHLHHAAMSDSIDTGGWDQTGMFSVIIQDIVNVCEK